MTARVYVFRLFFTIKFCECTQPHDQVKILVSSGMDDSRPGKLTLGVELCAEFNVDAENTRMLNVDVDI